MLDWDKLLSNAAAQSPPHAVAETFLKTFGTASRPVLLGCDDGREYVVKSRDAGRMIVTDQIVGRLGSRIGAPVPGVALVDVPADLIKAEPEMSYMSPGLAHASRWIPDCTERAGFEHAVVTENRLRFAQLALLYGWVVASDHQFIYENSEPRLVHSVDHGHFFAGSTGWTASTLARAGDAVPDAAVVGACGLTEGELAAARKSLDRPSDQLIAEAVATPPVDWGITLDERKAVAEYLRTRRDPIFGPAEENGDAPENEEPS